MQIMSNRMGPPAFANEVVDTETSLSSDDSQPDLVYFHDIQRLKKSVYFESEEVRSTQNLFQIDAVKTKELEKETMMVKPKQSSKRVADSRQTKSPQEITYLLNEPPRSPMSMGSQSNLQLSSMQDSANSSYFG